MHHHGQKTAAVAALVEVGGRGRCGLAVPARADRAAWPVERLREFVRGRRDASQQTRIGLVLADAEFDSERKHTYIRKQLGAQSVIPVKQEKKTWRIHGVRAEMRRAFPRRIYRRRALIESLFSSVKRKLSARTPGLTLPRQKRQALLPGLSFNLYRLKHRYFSPRMSTEPSYCTTLCKAIMRQAM
ncbi:MAG: transposase [Candidatus Acidiferrales bacterium]